MLSRDTVCQAPLCQQHQSPDLSLPVRHPGSAVTNYEGGVGGSEGGVSGEQGAGSEGKGWVASRP